MLRRGFLILVAAVMLPASAMAEVRLVMVEEAGCMWCARWNAAIAPIYDKTAEGQTAPLLRLDIHAPLPEGMTFDRRFSFTPTFVLVVDGQETGRIEGYPGEDFFWGLLAQMLRSAEVPVSGAG